MTISHNTHPWAPNIGLLLRLERKKPRDKNEHERERAQACFHPSSLPLLSVLSLILVEATIPSPWALILLSDTQQWISGCIQEQETEGVDRGLLLGRYILYTNEGAPN